MRFSTLICALGLLSLFPSLASAGTPPRYTGSIELRSPVWNSAFGGVTSPRNLEMAGDLKVSNLLGPVVLVVHGEHTFHQSGIVFPENKIRVGGELPLNKQLTFFSYYDYRYSKDLDRVFVGLRLNFRGGL